MSSTLTTTREAFVNGKRLASCTLNVEVEQIDVTAMTEPDPNWTFIDAAGHFHAYTKDFALPTLKRVEVTATADDDLDEDDDTDIDGSDEDWLDDVELDYSYTELHCRICDELVVPGTRTVTGRKLVPGRKSWSAEVTGLTEDLAPLSTQLVSVWMDSPRVFGVGMLLVSVSRLAPDGRLVGAIIQGHGELGSR